MIPPDHHAEATLAAILLLTAVLFLKTDRLRPVVLLFGATAVALALGTDATSLAGAADEVRAVIFRALP